MTEGMGPISGLFVEDLTDEQLSKVNLSMLFYCLDNRFSNIPNGRVLNILTKKIQNKEIDIKALLDGINHLEHHKYKNTEFFNSVDAIINDKYENIINYFGFKNYVEHWISEKTKYNLFIRSLKKKEINGFMSLSNVSYDWLNSMMNEEVKKLMLEYVDHHIQLGSDNKWSNIYNCISRFFYVIDSETANEYAAKILITNKDSSNFFRLSLANKGLKEDYIHYILKENRKNNKELYINTTITEKLLLRYAAITKLEVVEKILFRSNYDRWIFEEAITPDKLSELLFSAGFKYNKRLIKVVNEFTERYNNHLGEKNG